jgi:hypothetical protein
MEKLGITGTALNWFASYFSNKTQKVEVNSTLSDSKELITSVFQGTCLGPIIFLCNVNDLPSATDLLTILFADDTTRLDSSSDLPSLITRVQNELTKLSHWFIANKISLNVSKTKYIIFHVQGKRIERGTTLQIDANLPGTAHKPNLVTTVERIRSKHANYDPQALKFGFSTITVLVTESPKSCASQ